MEIHEDYVRYLIENYDEEYAKEQGIDKLNDEDIHNIILNILEGKEIDEIIEKEIEDYAGRKSNIWED